MFFKKKKTKVLIVDDVHHMLEILRTRFEGNNYDVITAAKGEEGIKMAVAEKPDVILMDIMMPEMDGMEACRRLKKDKRTQEIPVVAITALCATIDPDRDMHAKDIYEAGVQSILTKPFTPEMLIKRVEETMEYKRYIDKRKPKAKVVKS